jgi:D-arabinose 1-dehydrogenase-like Zn-dependent alcohol dehydrogenase
MRATSDGRQIKPRTMKAAVVREFGKPLRIEDVEIPEVVLDMEAG